MTQIPKVFFQHIHKNFQFTLFYGFKQELVIIG